MKVGICLGLGRTSWVKEWGRMGRGTWPEGRVRASLASIRVEYEIRL